MQIRQCAIIFKRLAATAAAAVKPSPKSFGKEEISRLPNGLTVFSKDMGGPVAQLVLAFRSGSRYEQSDEMGLTHHLRNCIGIDSEAAFGAQLLYQCGSAGVALCSHLTRDFFAVQASVVRENARFVIPLLCELGQPAFKPWDIEHVEEGVKADLAYLPPHDRVVDCLHYAAFRNEPLGNALYAREDVIGKYGYHKLCKFAESRLVSGQAVIVGINTGHEDIVNYVNQHLRMREKSGKAGPSSKYFGGEVRHPSYACKRAHVAIAGEGASLRDPKGVAVQSVLLYLLVGEQPVMYGLKTDGVVAQAIYKASSSYPYELSTISEIHSDGGLVGIYLSAEADIIDPLVRAAGKAMKSFTFSDDMLAKAKRLAELECLSRSERSFDVALECTAQLLSTNAVLPYSEFIKLLNGVTKQEIEKAIERMASKLTMASYGNLYQVPYLGDF